MTWLAPLAGAIVALSTIPPLVALYFLRLRRSRRVISSTMLWTRATEDLRANTPFQRLRFSLLLLLQLLALALVILAIAQPQADIGEQSARRVVLLIDRSGSMGTLDGPGGQTRLDAAKKLAKARIDQLHGGGLFAGPAPSVMIIAFARDAHVAAPFTTNAAQLAAAIDAIAQTDETTKIADAFELARAFTTVTNPDDPTAKPADPPSYELFSDGLIPDASQCALRPGETVIYRPVAGEETNNAGIAGVAAARSPDRPDEVEVYARVVNWGSQPLSTDVELRVDGVIRSVTPRAVDVPARSTPTGATTAVAGEAQVLFPSVTLPNGGVLTVRLVVGDKLEADDRASVVAPPREALSVALVGRGAFVLKSILDAMGLAKFESISLDEWNSRVAKDPSAPSPFDVVVFDAQVPATLPRGHYLGFGPSPPVEGLTHYATKENVIVRGLRDGHPLLEFVNLDDLFVASMQAVATGSDAETIVDASEGPLIVTLDHGGVSVVYVAFDPMESNWPFQRGFVTFVANAVRWLAAGGSRVTDEALAPGDVANIRLPSGATEVSASGVGGVVLSASVAPSGEASVGPLRRAGVYEVKWKGQQGTDGGNTRAVAVDMDSRTEGSVEGAKSIGFASERVAGVAGGHESKSALWPWLLLGACALLVVEWWVWLRRS